MSRVKERTNICFFKISICILGMFTKRLTCTGEGKLIFVTERASAHKNWKKYLYAIPAQPFVKAHANRFSTIAFHKYNL
jgi:hypothetical protein